MISGLLTSKAGRIFISIIWGLGIAALFRRVCKDRDCIVIKGISPQKINNKVFKYKDKCYKYTPEHTKCLSEGNVPI